MAQQIYFNKEKINTLIKMENLIEKVNIKDEMFNLFDSYVVVLLILKKMILL